MKKVMLLTLSLATLFVMGCNQNADVNSMLKNAELKDKVFSTILDDHELMTEFMDKMMSSEHAMMMMKGNDNMRGMMMGGGDMMGMMKTNPEMMNNTMAEMMKDGNMMSHLMQMMNQEGMISNECLQSSMKMMKDKGMPMDMGGMMGQ